MVGITRDCTLVQEELMISLVVICANNLSFDAVVVFSVVIELR